MVGLDSALQGLAQAQANFDTAAVKIARQTVSGDPQGPQEPGSLAGDIVDLLQARNDFEANLKTFQTGQEMEKALLDVMG